MDQHAEPGTSVLILAAVDQADDLSLRPGQGAAIRLLRTFPVVLAAARAAEFGRFYLNFNPHTPRLHDEQRAAFVPAAVVTAQLGASSDYTCYVIDKCCCGVGARC